MTVSKTNKPEHWSLKHFKIIEHFYKSIYIYLYIYIYTFADAGDGDGAGGDHLGPFQYTFFFAEFENLKYEKFPKYIFKYVHIYRK